jgi:hypothetical protein
VTISKPTPGATGWNTATDAVIDAVNALGGAASLAVGTTAGTVAAGNDARIVGALPKSGGIMTGALTPVNDVKAYGAVGDGTTDDTTAFTNALTAAASGNFDIIVPAGTYKLTSGITWDCEAGSLIGQGMATLDFSSMSSGYAVTVKGVSGRSSSLNNHSTTHELTGLQITGPDTDGTTVDGFLIQDVPSGSGNLSQVNVSDLYVFGFRDQFYFGDNTWCWRFQNCTLGHAHRRILSMFSGLNAGENYSFYGCTLFSSTNASFTATAVYGDVAGNVDAYFYGCSFDYNDVEFDWNSGVLNLIGCHVEDHANNGNPMVKLSYTGGNAHTTFTMSGGDISPTETTPGRDHLIETTGSNIALTFSGVKVGCFGQGTDLIKVLSGTPSYSWQGGDFDTDTGAVIAKPGSLANVLYNGDFELGNTTGWNNGGTVTYSAQSTTKASGTYGLKIAGVGTAGTSFIRQTYTCPPSVDVIVYADLASDTMTGGSVAFQVQFKAQDLTTISTTTIATISANQSFTRAGTKVRTPAGAAFMYVLFAPSSLNGNVYADNVYCAAMTPSRGGALVTFGTGSNQIAEGNDTRITGSAQKASNLSDLASASTARTNLGLGTAATLASSAVAQTANNLSDLASAATARTNLGTGPTPDVQVFTSSGTWTKPTGATVVQVICIGNGGGGGSGARRASGTATSGGAGGGGAGMALNTFRAADLGSTETVTIGATGTGASAISANDTSGSTGTTGGNATFGTTVRMRATGGSGGQGGQSGGSSSSGGGGAGTVSGGGGGAGASGAVGAGGTASNGVAGGGGAGGGVDAIPTAFTGGTGGNSGSLNNVGQGSAGAINGAGGAGTGTAANTPVGGPGGGGGGSSITTTGGTGGAGGIYGAGGGGGGSSLNGNNSGGGGTGATGIVIVTSW